MLKLTNTERAAIIRAACAEAMGCENPIFVIRDALAEALFGSGLDWNEVAEHIATPRMIERHGTGGLEALCDWLENDSCGSPASLLPACMLYALLNS